MKHNKINIIFLSYILVYTNIFAGTCHSKISPEPPVEAQAIPIYIFEFNTEQSFNNNSQTMQLIAEIITRTLPINYSVTPMVNIRINGHDYLCTTPTA